MGYMETLYHRHRFCVDLKLFYNKKFNNNRANQWIRVRIWGREGKGFVLVFFFLNKSDRMKSGLNLRGFGREGEC